MTTPHNLAELAPIGPLTDWLDANVPELGKGALTTAVLSGGTSNVVLTISRGGREMVLRRPPAVPPPGAEKGVLREARILTALNQTNVPHPHCYAVCDDASVIGAPFYVMEKVVGWAPNLRNEKIHNEPPFDKMPYVWRIPYAIVDGLIALANVDHVAIGLADYGKPGNFLARQVDRWAGQLASYKERYNYEGRVLEGFAETEAWLRSNVLKSETTGIIHGDVGTPNMMFHHGPPARLAAMIDWNCQRLGIRCSISAGSQDRCVMRLIRIACRKPRSKTRACFRRGRNLPAIIVRARGGILLTSTISRSSRGSNRGVCSNIRSRRPRRGICPKRPGAFLLGSWSNVLRIVRKLCVG